MLIVYLVALAFGGTLLLVSSLIGGDGDSETESDADVADSALALWLPIGSLRFWTVWLAFAGLTGTVLTAIGTPASTVAVAGLAGAVGWAAGAGITALVRWIKRDESGRVLGVDELTGTTARVVLPVGPGKTGKVRLLLQGRTIERLAETQESTTFGRDQEVLVYGVKDDGRVLVARAEG